MKLTQPQKLAIYKKLESNLSLGFTEALNFFDETLNNLRIEKQKEFEKAIGDMNKQIEALKLTVKDGYTPRKGIDYTDGKDGEPGKLPSDETLIQLIKPLIPPPKKGDPGEDSIVPGPKGDSIIGPPGRDGSPDKPLEIAAKLNTTTESVDQTVIKGLSTSFKNIYSAIREKAGGGKAGGGMGNIQHEAKNVSSSTTAITTNYNIAGNGFAVWAFYDGGMIARGTHYTVSGKTLSLTFTPQDGGIIDLIYIRT